MLFNYTGSKQRTFRDITKLRPDVVQAVLSTSPSDEIIKIYECGESRIIHSKNDKTNRASISNSKGCDFIQEWEITYMLDHILKESNENVVMYVSPNGVIYLQTKEANSLVN
ncbi:DUF1827 family protein [Lysinibacillus sp. 54212]|uniref:DUF1827 family protein n=1 Tax=Lysinibacillus sp. 54212 TaxID=3119829 RepID=UPI002FC950F0